MIKLIIAFILLFAFSANAAELVNKRTYTSKTFKAGSVYTGEFHGGHIHYKDDLGDFQDVELGLEDMGDYWRMVKGSYRVFIAKNFGADELVRFRNKYEGADHTIKFDAHSLWWFDSADKETRTKISNALGVTGYLVGNKVRYDDAFGSGIHYEITLNRHGVRKEIVVDTLADLGSPPYADYFLVPVFTWAASGVTVKASDLPDWDNATYYETNEAVVIRESSNPAYTSRILKARGQDSTIPRPRSRPLKVFFEKKAGTMYQGKLITKAMLNAATFPIRADTTATYNPDTSGDGYCVKEDAVWATAQNAVTSDGATDDATTLEIYSSEDGGYEVLRGFFPINTGAGLPDNAVVSGASFYVWCSIGLSGDNDGLDYFAVVQTTQAATNNLVVGDYDGCGDSVDDPTEGHDAGERQDCADANASWVDFEFNATGRGWVKVDDWTMLGMREGHDLTDEAPAAASEVTGGQFHSMEGANDPYLRVEYTLLIPAQTQIIIIN